MLVPAAPHDLDAQALAGRMDHTLLSPSATRADIQRLCAEALAHGFKAVCVNPCRLPLAVELLRGQPNGAGPLPITVCGFPLGASDPQAKAREAALAVRAGARELDMVLNIGALKDGDADFVRADMAGVVAACAGVPVKVIIEACLLTDAEKELACRLAVEAGAAFVKTSTGFAGGGATEADIRLLRRVVDGLRPGPGGKIGVKASGGIRTREDALRMLAAGADRLGTSASVAIVTA